MDVEVTNQEPPFMDITDAFDAISGYEETLVAQGEAMGIERGRELGIEEGRELGCAIL
uniref:Essential protein Yae1 N-terminal domain-containing protein n=1 Tax=Hyaloperonospora arabidopsidis (strain Emoy2) TaxID=559515 RepID=M4BGG8_HYAAE